MLTRAWYSKSIDDFLDDSDELILATLFNAANSVDQPEQRTTWLVEIKQMREELASYRGRGSVHFEFLIPRIGKRIDVLVIIDHVLFILEYKVGRAQVASAYDQVLDYALDLKHFHSTSHSAPIVPLVVLERSAPLIDLIEGDEDIFEPITCTYKQLRGVFDKVISSTHGDAIDYEMWYAGHYDPTPTIIEAASALYAGHNIDDISRSDAGAQHLSDTTKTIESVISESHRNGRKSICFVTGVPGAGKTLIGLNVAALNKEKEFMGQPVYLSGNGPLVKVLREALARDAVKRAKEQTPRRVLKKGVAESQVKAFIQNVHHFRDECLVDRIKPPVEHVAIFDEAQRAWNRDQTIKFMKSKKGVPDFSQSEADFLISCMDRHPDWSVIVCLVGGGQEINKGEAGINGWLDAISDDYSHWDVYLSPSLYQPEYTSPEVISRLETTVRVTSEPALNLTVSMRSYRSERVSQFIHHVLDLNVDSAKADLISVSERYPIVLTRNLNSAKDWIRSRARGNQRYGMVVSSQAERLKPYAIDVKSPMNPVHWFLNDKSDVRSSFYLESVATEFDVQGLELDWTIVAWDADLRFHGGSWQNWSFKGDRWERIKKAERQSYQKNAYRVLLTRARLGMVIVVPEGDTQDHTRRPEYYDETFNYLSHLGLRQIP